jgi:hypothetical protein
MVHLSSESTGQSKKTFMLDKRIERKLRYIQGNLIANSDDENWSLSKLINVMLYEALTPKRNIYDANRIKAFLEDREVNFDDEGIDEMIDRFQGL